MCQFISAIVKRNGDVFCQPEYTDSHEDLLDSLGLQDNGNEGFVRIEFIPGEKIDDPKTWNLKLDETNPPDWWTPDLSERVRDYMISLVGRHIVRESRNILLGGWWILTDGAEVTRVNGARIYAMLGSSSVTMMRGSSSVMMMRDSSTVKEMRDSSSVMMMRDSSSVKEMWDSSSVIMMRDSSTVKEMRDSSSVTAMWDASSVKEMWGSSSAPRKP